MADTKISALTAATTPLAGTEVLPIVQSSTTKKVSVADLTAGRVISASGGTFKASTAYGTVSVDNTGTTGGGGYTVKQNGTTCGAFGVSGWVKGDTTSNAALFSETGKSIEVFTNGSATAIGSFTTAGNWAPASGKGIDFSADSHAAGMTSELLSDYEEGTWTATLTGSVTGPIVPVTATGKYTKIGREVTVSISFNNVSTVGASGDTQITGLPFTAASNGFGVAQLFGIGSTAPASTVSGTTIYIVESGTTNAIPIASNTGRYVIAQTTYIV